MAHTAPLSESAQFVMGLVTVALVLALVYGLSAAFGTDPRVTLLYFAAWDATAARRSEVAHPTADVVMRWGMYAVYLWALVAVLPTAVSQ